MLDSDTARVVEFDIKRTSTNPLTQKRLRKILYNFVALYEHNMGYLQGMNFMANYVMNYFSSDLEVVKFFIFLSETVLLVSPTNSRGSMPELQARKTATSCSASSIALKNC